jgi:hypothetical protein
VATCDRLLLDLDKDQERLDARTVLVVDEAGMVGSRKLTRLLEALGPVPESTRGRRAWRHAAAQIELYRHSYHITDPERALGPEPHASAQRADRQRVRAAIERVHTKQRTTDRTHQRQPTRERTSLPRPHQQHGRPGPERAAG